MLPRTATPLKKAGASASLVRPATVVIVPGLTTICGPFWARDRVAKASTAAEIFRTFLEWNRRADIARLIRLVWSIRKRSKTAPIIGEIAYCGTTILGGSAPSYTHAERPWYVHTRAFLIETGKFSLIADFAASHKARTPQTHTEQQHRSW